ncbi:hypothetical protein IQ07DRAFT_590387 [Pyrenochaeta sp. DS3sAY3a]|nr:hypothetical protein IQ07DRAFT_590387 [Pyrenochaeta sp. DS3sAY3a]
MLVAVEVASETAPSGRVQAAPTHTQRFSELPLNGQLSWPTHLKPWPSYTRPDAIRPNTRNIPSG